MITAEQILEDKDLREKLINRLEVLDKVKQVVTMPNTDLLTVEQVADYYEADVKAIDAITYRHYDELAEDGYKTYLRSELVQLLNLQDADLKTLRGRTIATIDNQTIVIPNRGLRLFTRRALLRVGMLLRDSEVAKRVRTYLLDVENLATTEQKIQDIQEEDRLLLAVIKAKTLDERLAAMNELYQYIDRYKAQVDYLVKENNLLARGISSWPTRQAINKLVRKLAYSRYEGNFKAAWERLYDELLYKHNVNVRARINRKGGQTTTLFDVLSDDEVVKAFQSALVLCKEAEIDVSEVLAKVEIRV
jgi:ribosomal protein L17